MRPHRERFREAVTYARTAMASTEVHAVYEKVAAENHKRPFDVAVSDYFKGNDLLLEQQEQRYEKQEAKLKDLPC